MTQSAFSTALLNGLSGLQNDAAAQDVIQRKTDAPATGMGGDDRVKRLLDTHPALGYDERDGDQPARGFVRSSAYGEPLQPRKTAAKNMEAGR